MSSFRARFFKSCTVWNFKTCPVPMSRLKFFVRVWLRLLLKHTYSFQIIPAMVPLEGELRVNACVLVEVGRTYKSGRVHGISSASGEHYLIEIFDEDKPRKFTVKQIFPFLMLCVVSIFVFQFIAMCYDPIRDRSFSYGVREFNGIWRGGGGSRGKNGFKEGGRHRKKWRKEVTRNILVIAEYIWFLLFK